MKTFRGIGLMSGTSLDGLDLAYCSFSENSDGSWNYEFLETETVSYSKEWRDRLATVQTASAEVYAQTDAEYGELLGSILNDFIHVRKIDPDFAASHGHTIFHQPEKKFTAQIGDGETMAAHLPCPLVTNFRSRDLALGGQGAPLVPFGEKHLFPDCQLFLNLGGFANIAFRGIAYDVSPCNFALNQIVREHDSQLEFDPDGKIARSGSCNQAVLTKLNALPYYAEPPPKSLGREWFEEHFLPILREEQTLSAPDLLSTLTHHIASQIERAVAATEPRNTEILITGGGFKNKFLAELLKEKLQKFGITFYSGNTEQLVDYKEALIFAFLGLHTLLARTNILASATGAIRPSVSGSIHLPDLIKNGHPLLPFC
ncbi:MAG TPA: anhydro-N-acetylmuramic acid kinase [Opitutales bacterium]|nr:anhydro-N-acetylmuramic acid kinase [Opitutales bacterium]